MVRADFIMTTITPFIVRNVKYPVFRKIGKKSLEKYFHKIKKGHFKNVHFQKNSINNRPYFFTPMENIDKKYPFLMFFQLFFM
jgi:hypothetical protein